MALKLSLKFSIRYLRPPWGIIQRVFIYHQSGIFIGKIKCLQRHCDVFFNTRRSSLPYSYIIDSARFGINCDILDLAEIFSILRDNRHSQDFLSSMRFGLPL